MTTVCGVLLDEGFDPSLFAPLHSPAGLQIASMKPAEVAFSILSEMLMIKNGGDGRPMRIPVGDAEKTDPCAAAGDERTVQ